MRWGVLVAKTLRDHRGAAIGVGIVGPLMAFLDLLVYPEYSEMLKDFELPEALKPFIGEAASMASPEGFITAEFFSWIPLLLITVALIGATGTLAGEEGAGTLELLLAQPVSRRRLVLEKAAGLVAMVTLMALACFPGFLLGMAVVDFEIGLVRLFGAVVNMVPVTLVFLTLALLVSALLPGRGAAAMVAIGAVVVAYFLNTIGSTLEVLEIPRKLSPFYWADASHVLVSGFDWLRFAGMMGLAAMFLALAVRAFERRDIAAGGREWTLRRTVWRAVRRVPAQGEAAPEP